MAFAIKEGMLIYQIDGRQVGAHLYIYNSLCPRLRVRLCCVRWSAFTPFVGAGKTTDTAMCNQ